MKKAFTLIELVMVLLIVGILSAVVITDFSSSSATAKLEAARFRLKSDIIYAQNLAVTQQRHHGIVFDPALESYSLYSQDASNIVNNPLSGFPFTVSYALEPELKGIDLVAVSFGSPNTNMIEFDEMGRPYSDSVTQLAQSGSISLAYKGLDAVITVTKNTGMVN